MRLGAYSGVIAARAYEEQQADRRGAPVAAPMGTSGIPSSAPVNDPNLVNKLVADGWVEHKVERA